MGSSKTYDPTDPAQHRGLAFRIATQWVGRYPGIPLDDLYQEAILCIVKCTSGFDPSRGFKFSTYAARSIHNRLRDFVRQETSSGMITASVGQRYHKKSKLDQFRIDCAMKPMGRVLTDHAFGSGNDRDEPGVDAVPVTPSFAFRSDTALAIHKTLDRLPEVWATILRGRFFHEMTLEEIGCELGMSRERVRQLEEKALAAMRMLLEGKRPDYMRLSEQPRRYAPRHIKKIQPRPPKTSYTMQDGSKLFLRRGYWMMSYTIAGRRIMESSGCREILGARHRLRLRLKSAAPQKIAQ